MPTPPIPQTAWDTHVETRSQNQYASDIGAIDQAQAAQQHAEAHRAANDARDEADAQQRARAQIEAIGIAQSRNQEEVAAQRRAAAQIDAIRAPEIPQQAQEIPRTVPSAAQTQGAAQVGGNPLGRVYADARAAGLDDEGARAAVAVAETEKGYGGAQGDQTIGGSRGTFQFYAKGELPNYAASRGITPQQADAELAADPHSGNSYALSGYLGQAIKEGQAKGLSGASLAAYAQRYGQRSEDPDRAGRNYAAAQAALGDTQASPLAPPPAPGAEKAAYASARAPSRVEAVGQFEQGLPYDEAAAICGPVAALAFAQANSRNPSLAEVRALAKQRGWTSTGGMNGIANEQATLTDLGVKSRLDTDPDFGRIAADASSGNPVIISTPVHYYYASGYDPATGKVFVGKTGTSRKGGGSWMTPQEIATLDGGINGALFVDNPQSPAPSVGANQPDDGVGDTGDRPPSEFEAPLTPFADKAFTGQPDAVVDETPDDDQATPNRPPFGMPAVTPFGVVPVLPPTISPNVAPPGRREQERVQRGEAPIKGLEDITGSGAATLARITTGEEPLDFSSPHAAVQSIVKVVRAATDTGMLGSFIGRQLQTEPGVVAEQVRPGAAEEAEQAFARQEARGGYGGARGLGGLVSGVGEAVGGGPGGLEADVKKAAGETERLRLDKFPEDVRDTIAQAAERGDYWLRQRRNVIPDAEAEKMADELDRTVEQWVGGGRPGRAYNTEETRALRNALTGQAIRVDDLRATVEALGDKASDAARRSLGEEESRLLALSRVAEGARAEAGRSFRAYLADTQGRLARAKAPEYTNLSRVPIEAAPPLGAGAEVPRAARPGVLPGMEDVPVGTRQRDLLGNPIAPPPAVAGPSLYDRFQTVRFAGMLSSTATQILNNTANAVNTLADVGLKPVQAAIDAGVSAVRGGERTRYMAEVGPQVKGFVAGFLTGAKKIPHILATGVDPETAGALDLPRGGLRSGSKTLDAIVEAPLRALSAADAMWRGAAYAGHAAALATRQAVKEGLAGAERTQRVDHILSNLHEFTAIDEQATKQAARAVFQEHRPEIDPAIALLKGTKARYVSDVVLPFIRTPYNVAAQGIGMTPVGFAGALKAARTGQRGEAIDKAVRAAVGTGAMGYGLALAASGYITPATPTDAAERSTLPDGWKPYSLRIPRGDGAVYVPLQLLGPVAVPLGLAAALGDLYRQGQTGTDPQKLAYRSVTALGKYVGDQAFLQGLSALPNIIDEPERYLETFLEGYASSVMPASAFQKQVDQFLGRAPRDPKGAIEGFLAASPLTSQLVDSRRTPLGEDREPVAGPAAFLAGTRISAEHDEPTLAALRAAGAGIPAPPKEAHGVPLTEDERRRFQTIAGQRIRDTVRVLAGNARLSQLDPAIREKAYKDAVESARSIAGAQLLKEMGPDEMRRRLGPARRAS